MTTLAVGPDVSDPAAWAPAVHTVTEDTQRLGRFRFVTFCTFDTCGRTTRSLANGGWHQPRLQRAFALMNLRLPTYDPRQVATPVDANPLLRRVVDDGAEVAASIEAYTENLIPSLFAMILGRVAGGRHVVGVPVAVGGQVVGVLTGYQRRATADPAQVHVLLRGAAQIAHVLERACVASFDHGARGASQGAAPLAARPAAPAWQEASPVAELTPRLRDIWALVAQGHSNAAIAGRLGLSPRWVDNAVGQLYAALGIDTRDTAINARVQAALLFYSCYP